MPIKCQQFHPALSVSDVSAAVEFYVDKLGFTRGSTLGDPPSWANVRLDSVELHFVSGEPRGREGGHVYFVVGSVDDLFATYREAGVEIESEPGDRPHGMRDFSIRDPDGYRLVFGTHNTGDPIEVERVRVEARIEKRLAALLVDLADATRSDVGQLLEDVLLHSFEGSARGVASPYTDRQHARIAQLKRTHGIDYEAHDNYRFVERSGS